MVNHVALLAPAVTGHLNPMTALGREFLSRGSRVTLIGLPDAETASIRAGLEFQPYGHRDFPEGSVANFAARLGELDRSEGLIFTIEHYRREAFSLVRDVPGILRSMGCDGLLSDQTLCGGTAAEIAGIPYVTICNSLLLNPEPDVPPWTTGWEFDATDAGRVRNQRGYEMSARLVQPILDEINSFRRWNRLPPLTPPTSSSRSGDSPLATISQQPEFFDYPRTALPPTFHYAGPFSTRADGECIEFPYERLNGRPLIYASMGTLQNRQRDVFLRIAEACLGLDAQLVLSLGRKEAGGVENLPGNPVVVTYAPQRDLLRRASLVVTHAGLNTVLESLSAGVPMVAIPITNDQPGVAARLRYLGAGESIGLEELSSEVLRSQILRVLNEPGYKIQAERASETMQRIDGPAIAVDIALRALTHKMPVFRS